MTPFATEGDEVDILRQSRAHPVELHPFDNWQLAGSRSCMFAALAYLVCMTTAPFVSQCQETKESPDTPAQEQVGSVTGHVYCDDTHQVARLANVTLQPLSMAATKRKDLNGAVGTPTITTTDLNGRFTLSDLSPGTYLVLAWMPGYVSPLTQITEDTDLRAHFLQTLETVLPQVEVKGHQTSTIDVTLRRGAIVTGSVTYDDGTPAVGFHVKAMLPPGTKNGGRTLLLSDTAAEALGFDITDDGGHYRLSGLPAGSFVISISPGGSGRGCGILGGSCKFVVTPPNSGIFKIYSGNVLRLKDAKTFSVVEGGQRDDLDIVIPVMKLHQVAGVVVARSDGHPLRGGSVQLLYADDNSIAQTTHVNEDGTFVLNFVQDGTYQLKVSKEQMMPIEVRGNVTDLTVSVDSK